MSKVIIGIDASNIRAGGGLTHLKQFLAHTNPIQHKLQAVVVWGCKHTLTSLPEKNWIIKRYVPLLDKSLPWRIFWQQIYLPLELKKEGCQLLFSPGGTLPHKIKIPSLVMSQNMLPFEKKEWQRFSSNWNEKIKFKLIKYAQLKAMQRASAVLFLSKHARDTILQASKYRIKKYHIIPHGIDPQFFRQPKKNRDDTPEHVAKPFKLLYVSTIYPYKHQVSLVKAVAQLKQEGYPLTLTMVGDPLPTELTKLQQEINRCDADQKYIFYLGSYSYQKLHNLYHDADIYVFASTCENLPFSLLEAMASGLPIASSNKEPMPEVLQGAALYFNSEKVDDICSALRPLLDQYELRNYLANEAYQLATKYRWENTVQSTLSYIDEILAENRAIKAKSKGWVHV